jgi:hypothetical protein
MATECGLAPGELDAHLAVRLHRKRIIQDGSNLLQVEFMFVGVGMRVREANVAGKVATVGEVDREHGATPVPDGCAPVVSQRGAGAREVTTRKEAFDSACESRIDAQNLLEGSVSPAMLDHHNLAIPFDDPCSDLTTAVRG